MTMPWAENNYPPAMKNLPPAVRRRAIRIANALLREGYDEGTAIRMAIARAKKLARRLRLAKARGSGVRLLLRYLG